MAYICIEKPIKDNMYTTENAVLIQNATLDDIEAMVNKAVERRMAEFYDRVRSKPPVLIKRKDAAKMLGISLPTLDMYAKAGILHQRHIGGRVYYEEEEINKNKSKK